MSDPLQDDEADDVKGVRGRPLGRGLQDVSHLFLSPRPGAPSTLASSTTAVSHGAIVPLRPVQVTRDRLAELLSLDRGVSLEEGLRTIDARIPCEPCGDIDLLAIDRTGKLTIIDFDTTVNDSLVVRGLGHLEWITRNTETIRRMHPAQPVGTSLPPRLILVAPQFYLLARRAMRLLTRPQIRWVRCHVVETPEGHGILFEPVGGD